MLKAVCGFVITPFLLRTRQWMDRSNRPGRPEFHPGQTDATANRRAEHAKAALNAEPQSNGPTATSNLHSSDARPANADGAPPRNPRSTTHVPPHDAEHIQPDRYPPRRPPQTCLFSWCEYAQTALSMQGLFVPRGTFLFPYTPHDGTLPANEVSCQVGFGTLLVSTMSSGETHRTRTRAGRIATRHSSSLRAP